MRELSVQTHKTTMMVIAVVPLLQGLGRQNNEGVECADAEDNYDGDSSSSITSGARLTEQ